MSETNRDDFAELGKARVGHAFSGHPFDYELALRMLTRERDELKRENDVLRKRIEAIAKAGK